MYFMGWESVLRKDLQTLYGRDVPEVWDAIKEFRSERANEPDNGPILITYPDAVEGWTLKDWERMKSLGFSSIHYLPTLFPFSNDRGFSVVDFRKIRQGIGDWSDISGFMVDLVLNHVSEWHDWFIRARLGEREYLDYFITFPMDEFRELEEKGAFSKVIRPRDTPLFKKYEFALPFSWDELEGFAKSYEDEEFERRYGNPAEFVQLAKQSPCEKWVVEKDRRYMKYDGHVNGILHLLKKMGRTEERMVWTTFSTPYGIDQVDLNYRNPRVLAEMIGMALFYARRGASYLRLDAVPFSWKELFTPCMHGKAELFPRIFKSALRSAGYKTRIVTESNVPLKENLRYLEKGSDMIYNFTLQGLLLYALGKDPRPLFRHLPRVCGDRMFNFLSTHDGISLRGIEGLPEEEEIKDWLASVGTVKYRKKGGKRVPYEVCSLPSDFLEKEKLRLGLLLTLFLKGVPGIYYAVAFASRNGTIEKEERDAVRPVISNPDMSFISDVMSYEPVARKFRMSKQSYITKGSLLTIVSTHGSACFDFSSGRFTLALSSQERYGSDAPASNHTISGTS